MLIDKTMAEDLVLETKGPKPVFSDLYPMLKGELKTLIRQSINFVCICQHLQGTLLGKQLYKSFLQIECE